MLAACALSICLLAAQDPTPATWTGRPEVALLTGRQLGERAVYRIRQARTSVIAVVHQVQVNADDADDLVHRLADALGAAARRSPAPVDVRVVLDENRGTTRENWAEFVEAVGRGPKLGWWRRGGQEEGRRAGGEGVLHAKVIIVDYEWVLLGSHNWTETALGSSQEGINIEASVEVRDREFARRLAEYLEEGLRGGSFAEGGEGLLPLPPPPWARRR